VRDYHSLEMCTSCYAIVLVILISSPCGDVQERAYTSNMVMCMPRIEMDGLYFRPLSLMENGEVWLIGTMNLMGGGTKSPSTDNTYVNEVRILSDGPKMVALIGHDMYFLWLRGSVGVGRCGPKLDS
jgi:hypothetical protein